MKIKSLAKTCGILGLEAILSFSPALAGGGNKPGCESNLCNECTMPEFEYPDELTNRNLGLLQENEFVIENDVFDAYARTVDKTPEWLSNPIGGYLAVNYIDKRSERKEFSERLKKLGIPKSKSSAFYRLFTTSGIIVFRKSALSDSCFGDYLGHERFHKEMRRLSRKDYKYMADVAYEIARKRVGFEDAIADKERWGITEDEVAISQWVGLKDVGLLEEKIYPGQTSGGGYKCAVSMNPGELYPYLAGGKFRERVENYLRREHPMAYDLYSKIRAKVGGRTVK